MGNGVGIEKPYIGHHEYTQYTCLFDGRQRQLYDAAATAVEYLVYSPRWIRGKWGDLLVLSHAVEK